MYTHALELQATFRAEKNTLHCYTLGHHSPWPLRAIEASLSPSTRCKRLAYRCSYFSFETTAVFFTRRHRILYRMGYVDPLTALKYSQALAKLRRWGSGVILLAWRYFGLRWTRVGRLSYYVVYGSIPLFANHDRNCLRVKKL